MQKTVGKLPIEIIHAAVSAAHEIESQRRREQTECLTDAGAERRNERRQSKDFGDPIAVQRARAAKGVLRQPTRIFAALSEMSTRRVGHVLVDDLMNAPGDLLGVHPQLLTQPAQRLARAVEIELHLAAKKITRIEIAEHEIGVGYRWFRAALPITHGARIGAGAFRTDF